MKILILNDDQQMRRSLSSRLKLAGPHDVHLERDVASALALLKGQDFDLVFVDMDLGTIDAAGGLGFLRVIRPWFSGVAVALGEGFTGHLVREAMRHGASEYVQHHELDARLLADPRGHTRDAAGPNGPFQTVTTAFDYPAGGEVIGLISADAGDSMRVRIASSLLE